MPGKEISLHSPTSITLTKSSEGIKVTLNLELSEPKNMELALSLLEEIKQNLAYPRTEPTAPTKHDALPQHFYQMDLPRSVRYKLAEQAAEENCSINTLFVHLLSRLC